MESFWQDLRYSVRTLAKHPAFAATGVLVLALGIGVNTAIFSVINAVLLRPLAVHAPHELRYLYTTSPRQSPYASTQYREFVELREQNTVFTDVFAILSLRPRVRMGAEVERLRGEAVSQNYFDVLGVQPLRGRSFQSSDDATTAEPVAIVSYDVWQSRFNGDEDVLGKGLELNRSYFTNYYGPWKRYTIVGVMPKGFRGLANPWETSEYWIPLLPRAAEMSDEFRLRNRGRGPDPLGWSVLPVARLKPGISSEQAAAQVATFAERFRANRRSDEEWTLQLFESRRIRLPFDPRGEIVPERLAVGLLAVSGILLLIAAANLGGMLVARGVSRRGEITLRLTLGAGPWRLARQLLTETFLLAAAGGVLGILFAYWLIDLFLIGTPTRFARWQIATFSLEIPIDGRVLAMTALSCLATGLLVGIAPVLQALRTDPARGLAGGGAGATRIVRTTLRQWIVVPQVCLSLVLLIAAGVMVRTLLRSELLDPGYAADQVVLLEFELPEPAYLRSGWTAEAAAAHAEQRRDLHERLLERARSAPQFSSVTVASTFGVHGLPLPSLQTWIVPRDRFSKSGQHYWSANLGVGTEYFRTLNIDVLHGRVFDARDRTQSPRVAVVSEQLARWMWPDRNPVGEYFGVHQPDSNREPAWLEVIGVVRDVDPPFSDGWRPAYYTAVDQQTHTSAFTLVARGRGRSADLLRALREAVVATDTSVIPTNGRTLHEAVGELLYPRRASVAILGLAGIIGLVLASAGLYGVMSFSAEQRVIEIGVRMALGAARKDIRRMILKEGLTVIVFGVVLGFALAYAAIQLTARFLVPLPEGDPLTFIAVPLVLSIVILVACYVPAARASRVNPIEALRAL